jgi:hypothetical protein
MSYDSASPFSKTTLQAPSFVYGFLAINGWKISTLFSWQPPQQVTYDSATFLSNSARTENLQFFPPKALCFNGDTSRQLDGMLLAHFHILPNFLKGGLFRCALEK